jgi:hypothetical protein
MWIKNRGFRTMDQKHKSQYFAAAAHGRVWAAAASDGLRFVIDFSLAFPPSVDHPSTKKRISFCFVLFLNCNLIRKYTDT